MKKALYSFLIIYAFCGCAVTGPTPSTPKAPDEYMEMSKDTEGAALSYPLNESPGTTDQVLGVANPTGAWEINRFPISSIGGGTGTAKDRDAADAMTPGTNDSELPDVLAIYNWLISYAAANGWGAYDSTIFVPFKMLYPNSLSDNLRDKFKIFSNDTESTVTISRIISMSDIATSWSLTECDGWASTSCTTVSTATLSSTGADGRYVLSQPGLSIDVESGHSLFINAHDTDEPEFIDGILEMD